MKIFSKRNRAPHLGKYPMEKIKRVARTTTYISNDVPRVPKRANFFNRAMLGDLGAKAKRERPRFVNKLPFARAMGKICGKHMPMHSGEPVDTQAPLPEDLTERAEHFKSLCYFLNADVVGTCEVPDHAWYSHDEQGNEIEPYHKYAIVVLVDQGFETLDAASGDDWISNAQSFRGYMWGSNIACTVADYIRQMGYSARAHTNFDSDVLHIPLVMLAGLGELSRIGEVVLNPFIGPRFKSTVITTDMPLAADQPIDFGLQDFCNKCMKCAVECPAHAISFGDKVMFNGYEMWKPDVAKCVSYRVTNSKGGGCGRCMKMCPFNKEGLLAHRIALWGAIKIPALRGLLARMDDWFGYGKRNEKKKWWWDLEVVDKKITVPEGVNKRELVKGATAPSEQRLGLYPADTVPAADRKESVPVDRKAGMKRYEQARQENADRIAREKAGAE
jgi:reductive dehalogenase